MISIGLHVTLFLLWYAAYKGYIRFLHIFWLPQPAAKFKIGGRFDQTFIAHFAGTWLLCLPFGWSLALLVGLGIEIVDGFYSDQGADPFDLLADLIGIAGWYFFSGEQLINLVEKYV